AIWATSRVRRVAQASVTPIDRNAVLPRLVGQLYAGGVAIGSFSRGELALCDTWRGRKPRFATPPGARAGGSRELRHLPVRAGGGSRDLRHLPVREKGDAANCATSRAGRTAAGQSSAARTIRSTSSSAGISWAAACS